jgi:hypothetical protein
LYSVANLDHAASEIALCLRRKCADSTFARIQFFSSCVHWIFDMAALLSWRESTVGPTLLNELVGRDYNSK